MDATPMAQRGLVMGGRRQRLADGINTWIAPKVGFWVSTTPPRHQQDLVHDPRAYSYYGSAPMIRARIDEGVCHDLPLGPRPLHPWALAVRLAVDSDDMSAIRPVLETYYSLVRPLHAVDWLDVPATSASGLISLPASAAVKPWSPWGPDEVLHRAARRKAKERRHYNLDDATPVGDPKFGPLTEAQIDAEVRKLSRLATSIRTFGLDTERGDYDPLGIFLIDGSERRWYPTDGQHRAAVAAGLGLDHLPITIHGVVRRDEVDVWPQVVSGLFDPETAVAVFDRCMRATPPRVAEPWLAWIERHDPGAASTHDTGGADHRTA